jgi:flagellar motor protein MotB
MDPGKGKDAWQASLARAREVLRVMVQADRGGGLPTAKWSVAGFGDTIPLKSNDPKGGKVASGRVEIEILPEAGELVDLGPLAAPAPAAP